MTLLRGMGALLLPICGWLAGNAVEERDIGHLTALEQTIRLLQRLRQEIQFRRADLQQLFCRLRQEGAFSLSGDSFWTMPAPAALSQPEKQCFAECMSGLGKSTAEQECQRLDYYIARFAEGLQQAQRSAQARAGLPRRLGLAAGAVLALMIL